MIVSDDDRARLEAIVADRNRPQKHVARARIILHSAERLAWRRLPAAPASAGRRSGAGSSASPRPASTGWCATRPGSPASRRRQTATVRRVVALTCGEPPGEATHWTGRMMAKAAGLSLRTVQRIWAAHRLQPHRLRSFKRSRDPEFITKLADIVGSVLGTRRAMRSCSRSTKRARSRPSTAPSRACRSSPAKPGR